MKPSERYASDLAGKLVTADAEQRKVVDLFDELYHQLEPRLATGWPLRSTVRRWLGDTSPAPAGVWLWGGVGRGKTWLMDLFCDCLPCERKVRIHYHRFMQWVHAELNRLQGRSNPLDKVAARIRRRARVLCLDEFFVLDIGDAMILAGLLAAFFRRGMVLIATSNLPPARLYENGLQRQRFMPAIELLEQHTRVMEIGPGIDYRLRNLSQATLYHVSTGPEVEQRLLDSFLELAPDRSKVLWDQPIMILDRPIASRCYADDVVWFEFAALCDGPRGAFDYVELARVFHAIILSSVPVMNDSSNDQARRFVSLIDELYDRRVKLIVAAAAPIRDIYRGQGLAFEFERTCSRLVEMQSVDYLRHGHRP